ncbi:hypothetical protein F4777DRAFT_562910 [Nemania sp. FL0916]|nr:hypothetical protein F4777DRAFT_562910 [Nemania sp. FL0916]
MSYHFMPLQIIDTDHTVLMASTHVRRNLPHLGPRSIRKTVLLSLAVLDVLLPISTTFMLWKGLSVLTNSSYPIVCVVSESMAPTFYRGDLLLLWNWTASAEPGDIPVVWFYHTPLPMVHRIVQTTQDSSGLQSFLIKGDNNNLNDVVLYPGERTSVF